MEDDKTDLKKDNRKPPHRLRCCVQNYDWGIVGVDLPVARLFSLNSGSGSASIDPNRPYAELWIGTHESGPSFVVVGDEDEDVSDPMSLKSWILDNPNVLGNEVLNKWGFDLPFLFKVLSVGKALSIQVHPDKETAKVLHKSQPSIYTDANHKPEMTLALTDFEALCSFISFKELKDVMLSVPEIVELAGETDTEKCLVFNEQDESEEETKAVLQSIFSQLMLSSKDIIGEMISKMKRRLNFENKKRQLTDKEHLVLRLESQSPADAGVMAAFLLNYVKLKHGEAFYIGPNEPHAYISGECIECMATSNNVVRAGLTPKHRDVQTLLSMLKYRQGFPEIL